MSDHAPLSFSASSRWLKCSGSLYYEKHLPAKAAGAAADRGTRIHEAVAANLLTGAPLALDDAQDQDWAIQYTTYVTDLFNSLDHAEMFVEQRVELTQLAWGTADCIIKSPGRLDVLDLKTGQMRVEAKQNPQLMLYALAALEDDADLDIHLHIVQPSIAWSDVWTIEGDGPELAGIATQVFEVQRILTTEAWEFNPGEEACNWCRGKNYCTARTNRVAEIAALEDFAPPAVDSLQVSDYQRILPHLDAIEKWCSDLREHCVETLQADSQAIPGFGLVDGPTQRRWINPEAVIAVLMANGIPVDMAVRRDAPTIGAVEKMLGKNHVIFQTQTKRTDPKPKVIQIAQAFTSLE